MEPEKTVRDVKARSLRFGTPLEGYEIHLGRTAGPDCARPTALVNGVEEGAASPDGKVIGTYLHGLFGADAFRARFLESLGVGSGGLDHRAAVEGALDAIAARLEAHLDCDALFAAAR
jgi:adenosylcobyric acid synthase